VPADTCDFKLYQYLQQNHVKSTFRRFLLDRSDAPFVNPKILPICGAPCNVNFTGAVIGSHHPGAADCGLMFGSVQTSYELYDTLSHLL